MRKKYLNNKGLSLVEVVMSAVIVSLLMAGLYAVYISAKNMTALALHKAVALAWASSKIEGQKHGNPNAIIDPSDENMLANEGFRGAGVAENPVTLGSMIRTEVTVTWTE